MKIDPQFPTYWKQYLMQSSYAAVTVFFITIILSNNPVVIASIGATAFIVFAMPDNVAAEPKRIIGGHLVGFFVGSCFAVFPFMDILFFKAVWFAASVGITSIIQPGGSIKDDEVIKAANEADIAMIFTGMRHFRH